MADKKYHIEGDTLIVNDGVTDIEKEDFHTYDEDGKYKDVKDEAARIKKAIIPESVTSIGKLAFYNCKNLKSVTIQNGVKSIGLGAFGNCKSLTSITIPDSVSSIGEDAFRDCYNLTNITIPDSVTNIGYWAFESCESLKNITIPDSVTSIGKGAFYGCTSLESITIPDSVTSIGTWVFKDCESLTSVTIPSSVTNISEEAFAYCKNLAIICNKGSYAEQFAKKNNIPVEYIGEHTKDEHIKEQAFSQIKDYINTLAEAMKHYDGKGDVGTYLEGYVGSSGADLNAFLSETSAAYIRNCFVSAYSGVDFNDTEDKSPTERYETRISSAVDKATSLAEELVDKSEKTSVEKIVDDVMQNEDFKNILKNELNAENDYYFSQEDYDNRLDSYTEEYNEVKAEILEIHKDAINSGKMSEQDINEMIGADMNTDYPAKEECVVYIRDIKDAIIENGAGTLTLSDFGDKHYNVQVESDSEIYTFKVSLPVNKTVGGVKVQGFKELGYIDVGKDEVGKALKEIAENTVIVSSKEYGSKPLNELLEKNSKAIER